MKIEKNNVDITNELSKCIYETNIFNKPDSLKFNTNVSVVEEDIIELKAPFKSGALYPAKMKKMKLFDRYTCIASKVSLYEINNRTWRDVYLSQIITQIARYHEMEVKLQGFKDVKYTFMEQKSMSDIKFLNMLAKNEGYILTFFDENIVFFKLDDFTNKNGSVYEVSTSDDFSFETKRPVFDGVSISIMDRTLIYAPSTSKRKHLFKYVSQLPVTTEQQALSTAENIYKRLMLENTDGYLETANLDGFIAGTVISIRSNGKASDYLIIRSRHDLITGLNKYFLKRMVSEW